MGLATPARGSDHAGRRRAVAVAVGSLVIAVGCTDGQDPGLAPEDRPAQTSDTLGPCPPDGPDATTPPAGCLGPDGRVLPS